MWTIKGLLDSAPDDLEHIQETTMSSIPGVVKYQKLRVRPSGAHLFIDAHVVMDGSLSLEEAHTLTEKIQAEVKQLASEIDFTVHAEPPQKIEDPKVESPKIVKQKKESKNKRRLGTAVCN